MGHFDNSNFLLVLGVVVMAVMGGSIIGPILPALIKPLGVTDTSVGLVLSIYTLFALISTPIFGVLGDRVGRKKVLVPTVFLFGLAGMSIALVSDFSFVLILRAIQGICVGAMMNLGVTLIGDFFEGYERAKAMGYRTSAQNIANAIMPLLAGSVATISWFYPFFIYSLSIPLAVLIWFKLDLLEESGKGTFSKYIRAAALVIRQPKTVWIFVMNLMLYVLLYCLVVYMPMIITENLGFSTVFTGLAITVAAGTSAIFSYHTGKLRTKINEHLLVLAGFSSCGLALFFVAISDSLLGVLLPLTLWGAGFALVLPTINTLATEQAPLELRAGVMAVFSMMIYLGQTISPPSFALILEAYDLSTVFWGAATLSLVPIGYTIIQYFVDKKDKDDQNHHTLLNN